MSNKRLKIAVFLLVLSFCAIFALRANRTTGTGCSEQGMRDALREMREAKTEQDAEKAVEKMGEAFEKMLEEKKTGQTSD